MKKYLLVLLVLLTSASIFAYSIRSISEMYQDNYEAQVTIETLDGMSESDFWNYCDVSEEEDGRFYIQMLLEQSIRNGNILANCSSQVKEHNAFIDEEYKAFRNGEYNASLSEGYYSYKEQKVIENVTDYYRSRYLLTGIGFEQHIIYYFQRDHLAYWEYIKQIEDTGGGSDEAESKILEDISMGHLVPYDR